MIVVPCYNERKRLLADSFGRFVEKHRDINFIFVNDCSSDGTEHTLRRLCASAPGALRCIALEKHVGKAEAVRKGMLEALSDPDVRYVGYWDADLAAPLGDIATFARILDQHVTLRLVMGARVQLLGRRIVRSALRHYAGRIFATMASRILSLPVYDTQCGAKLFRVSTATRALFQQPFASRWIFDVEILARMIVHQDVTSRRGIEELVYEAPLPTWEDMTGSHRTAHDYFAAARDLALIWHTYRRGLRRAIRKDRCVQPPQEVLHAAIGNQSSGRTV